MIQSEIRPARPEDLILLFEDLREREREAFNQYGEGAEKIVMRELAQSTVAFTGWIASRPVALWGVRSSILGNSGVVWLLGTESIDRHKMTFLRHSREAFSLVRQNFSHLYGVVSTDFSCSVHWLKWLGFTVGPDEAGIRRFEWTR